MVRAECTTLFRIKMISIDSIRVMLAALRVADTEQREKIIDVIDSELEKYENYFNEVK